MQEAERWVCVAILAAGHRWLQGERSSFGTLCQPVVFSWSGSWVLAMAKCSLSGCSQGAAIKSNEFPLFELMRPVWTSLLRWMGFCPSDNLWRYHLCRWIYSPSKELWDQRTQHQNPLSDLFLSMWAHWLFMIYAAPAVPCWCVPSVNTTTFGFALSDSRGKGDKIHPSCDAPVLLKRSNTMRTWVISSF